MRPIRMSGPARKPPEFSHFNQRMWLARNLMLICGSGAAGCSSTCVRTQVANPLHGRHLPIARAHVRTPTQETEIRCGFEWRRCRCRSRRADTVGGLAAGLRPAHRGFSFARRWRCIGAGVPRHASSGPERSRPGADRARARGRDALVYAGCSGRGSLLSPHRAVWRAGTLPTHHAQSGSCLCAACDGCAAGTARGHAGWPGGRYLSNTPSLRHRRGQQAVPADPADHECRTSYRDIEPVRWSTTEYVCDAALQGQSRSACGPTTTPCRRRACRRGSSGCRTVAAGRCGSQTGCSAGAGGTGQAHRTPTRRCATGPALDRGACTVPEQTLMRRIAGFGIRVVRKGMHRSCRIDRTSPGAIQPG